MGIYDNRSARRQISINGTRVGENDKRESFSLSPRPHMDLPFFGAKNEEMEAYRKRLNECEQKRKTLEDELLSVKDEHKTLLQSIEACDSEIVKKMEEYLASRVQRSGKQQRPSLSNSQLPVEDDVSSRAPSEVKSKKQRKRKNESTLAKNGHNAKSVAKQTPTKSANAKTRRALQDAESASSYAEDVEEEEDDDESEDDESEDDDDVESEEDPDDSKVGSDKNKEELHSEQESEHSLSSCHIVDKRRKISPPKRFLEQVFPEENDSRSENTGLHMYSVFYTLMVYVLSSLGKSYAGTAPKCVSDPRKFWNTKFEALFNCNLKEGAYTHIADPSLRDLIWGAQKLESRSLYPDFEFHCEICNNSAHRAVYKLTFSYIPDINQAPFPSSSQRATSVTSYLKSCEGSPQKVVEKYVAIDCCNRINLLHDIAIFRRYFLDQMLRNADEISSNSDRMSKVARMATQEFDKLEDRAMKMK